MTEYRTLLSNFVKKSQTNGLLKNDGTVDTTSYISTSNTQGLLKNDGTVDATSYISTSNTQGLLKNDGTVDTTNYLSTHQDITGKEDKSNKVTSISSSSTDTQYPSAKLVYNQLSEKATKTELNKKLDADSRIVTTFTPQDYQYVMSNGSWTNGHQVSLSASGQLALDLGDMLTLQDNYVEFIVQTGANSVSFGILYGNSNEPIASFPSNSTRRIKVIVGNSLEYTISDENNNTLNQFSVNYPVITFSSSSATTLNFGEKKWYHYVPFIDRVYPIGSIYMSVNSVNPSLFIGGEWEQIEDRFLLASGSTYGAGSTGGSATVTLTASQSGVPAHSHKYQDYNTTYTLKTTNRKPGTSTAVAYGTSLTSGGGATERTSSNNTAANASQAHENMPPYMTVYMWKRTA